MVVVYAPSNDVYYAALVAGPIFKEMADKIYATNIEMHRELQPDSSFADSDMPTPKPGMVKQAKQVMDQLKLASKPILADADWITTVKSDKKEKIVALKIEKEIVPNVLGMGLRDAIYLLESQGLQVTVKGSGSVMRQSLNSGMKIIKGQQIIIELG